MDFEQTIICFDYNWLSNFMIIHLTKIWATPPFYLRLYK